MGKKKYIKVVYIKPSQLKHDFGNPRKVSKNKLEELKKSLEKHGDHDIIKIDENNNIISGNQRIKVMLEMGTDAPIACKKLIGFTKNELKAINVQSNTHVGEWDYDKLDEWEDDLKEFDVDYLDKDIIVIENNDEGYMTTTQKQKYLQDKMLIKIGKIEIYLKKNEQPKNYKIFYKKLEEKKDIKKIVLKSVSRIANEICDLVSKR